MKTSPINSKNRHENNHINWLDLSLNNPFLDGSGVFFTNPLFLPLQRWKKHNKTLLLEDNNQKDKTNPLQKRIKQPKPTLNMRLSNILENIREERKYNSNDKNHHFMQLKNTLDKTPLTSKTIDISNGPRRDSLDDLILQITKKYDLIQYNHPKNKTLFFNAPPKPLRNRRSSTYIPPMIIGGPSNMKILKPPPPPPPPPFIPIEKKHVEIDQEVNGLGDILGLLDKYPLDSAVEYNINMRSIHNIKKPLNELNCMIGMRKLKDSIVDQIIYFSQDLHINKKTASQDFMHTCIYGPPGTGKTEIAKIIGKIFSSLGVLKKNYFRKVTRSDLIAGYLGQTAIKTKDVIKESIGGVLFIDEAYALGNPEKRDSFAKECIDTLCEALSDNKEKLMVIIAGYEKDLDKCFFAYNQGLDSRFPWRFKTDKYNASELNMIFKKKVKDAGWSLKEEISDDWFSSKMTYFKYYGRDMETLLAKTKIAHGRRVFCKPKKEKTKLTMKDMETGFAMFLDNEEVKKRNSAVEGSIQHMYL